MAGTSTRAIKYVPQCYSLHVKTSVRGDLRKITIDIFVSKEHHLSSL